MQPLDNNWILPGMCLNLPECCTDHSLIQTVKYKMICVCVVLHYRKKPVWNNGCLRGGINQTSQAGSLGQCCRPPLPHSRLHSSHRSIPKTQPSKEELCPGVAKDGDASSNERLVWTLMDIGQAGHSDGDLTFRSNNVMGQRLFFANN